MQTRTHTHRYSERVGHHSNGSQIKERKEHELTKLFIRNENFIVAL